MAMSIPEHEMSAALATLQNLSDADLQGLLENEARFDSYVDSLAQVRAWEAEKDRLMSTNKSLAERNLGFEPVIRDGKAALMDLYEKARSLTDELETKRATLESLSSRTSLDTTYALLQTASAEAEEESEAMSEKYTQGQMDTESFVAQFVPLRTNAHLRRIKAEKMGELVSSQRNRGTSNFSSALPYPTNPQSMPMPGLGMM